MPGTRSPPTACVMMASISSGRGDEGRLWISAKIAAPACLMAGSDAGREGIALAMGGLSFLAGLGRSSVVHTLGRLLRKNLSVLPQYGSEARSRPLGIDAVGLDDTAKARSLVD